MPLSKIQDIGNQVIPNLGRRNIAINGAMQVAQRATSATGVGSGFAYPTLDRYKIVPSTSGRVTMTQTADGPAGFANCLKLECTTADTSIASGEYFILRQSFEGQDLQQFKKGTSSAEKITVSFYVKGNAAATYTCELDDSDNTRHNSQEFSVTTDWTRVILTFDGDTTGAFDDDNARSMNLEFWLHAGSDYTGGTHTDNVWHTTNNQRVGDSQTSFFDSTSRTFFITGIQMEVGDKATDFEHQSFGDELQKCERYYQVLLKHGDASDGGNTCLGVAGVMYNTSYMAAPFGFRTQMRASPTLISANSTGCFKFYRNNSNDVFDDFSTGTARSTYSLELYNNSDMSGTAGHAGFIYAVNSNATLVVDAEL